MSEYCEGGYRFENLYSKAYWAKREMNVPARKLDFGQAEYEYKMFLEEKVEQPTRANIAMAEVIRNTGVNMEFFLNKSNLEASPELDCLVKTIEDHELKNYPKTRKLRDILTVENMRLNEVSPKINSKLKKLFVKFMAKI